MDAQAILAQLQRRRGYDGQVVATHVIDARPAEHGRPQAAIPEPLIALLDRMGIPQLYAHQAEAYDALRGGQHAVICTGTASGKSLCYHLPVLAELCEDTQARALYLFPAKALAQDQLGGLERMVAQGGLERRVRPACYDGDTPTHRRQAIRRSANVLLSNPDMLHVNVLPYHAKWAGFLARLRYLVLDEIHTYRGIFGSHVAGVVRRLLRLCRHYGSSPQIVCCSATLGNPRELAERLTGRPMRLIDRDGSPRGRKLVVLWNPPWLDGGRVGRRSSNVEAQELMEALLEAGAGTIAFAKARVVAELLYKYLRESLAQRRSDLARRIRPYRGGYLPNERREIEQALFSGELLGVCSTNALELGIDVGSLDAAILIGFPRTRCSFWQQVGRAGRRREDSIAFFVGYDDPIDQYLMRDARFLFDQPVEHAIIDPDNACILAEQLSCAAAELPLGTSDLADFGPAAEAVCDALEAEGRLRRSGPRWYWATADLPQSKTNLRTISNATYAIVDVSAGGSRVLGQVDAISAPELVYPEAIYLHQAESYVVRELDPQARLARVERFDADYYTQPILASSLRVTRPLLERPLQGGSCGYGDAVVRWATVAFKKIRFYTMEVIGQTALDLPAQEINTSAVWLLPPEEALRAVLKAGLRPSEALAGVRNLLTVMLPVLAMSDRFDVGGVSDSTQLGQPALFLYDRFEGGVGYARRGYECAERLLAMVAELLAGCPCEEGCPACVGPPNLRVAIHHDPDLYRQYEIPDKAATRVLLDAWLR